MTGDLQDVLAHYEQTREDERLRGLGELELCRTQEVLRRHLGPPAQRILDVGGGPGAHARWLIEEGHRVHLIDLSPRHVELAVRDLAASGLTAEVGDARQLPQRDGSVDAVLLLGPLYHLQRRDERVAALREARRVVVPGGIVAAAAISRFASLFDGLARGFLFDEAFRSIVGRDLESGCHENPENRPDWFTTAYFHHPSELAGETVAAGLQLVELVGIEGLAGWLPGLEERWRDDADRGVILESARLIEAQPELLGLSAHLLAVARA
jgi:ubiquinone/menaquinone biosynthesis C-methylase UbiE